MTRYDFVSILIHSDCIQLIKVSLFFTIFYLFIVHNQRDLYEIENKYKTGKTSNKNDYILGGGDISN